MPFRSHVYEPRAEIDISDSKLLGFETCAIFLGFGLKTFANFWRVSVSENLVPEKSLGFGFEKFGIGKKVSVSVLVKILVSTFSDQELHKMKKCPYMYQDKLRSKPKCEIVVMKAEVEF